MVVFFDRLSYIFLESCEAHTSHLKQIFHGPIWRFVLVERMHNLGLCNPYHTCFFGWSIEDLGCSSSNKMFFFFFLAFVTPEAKFHVRKQTSIVHLELKQDGYALIYAGPLPFWPWWKEIILFLILVWSL